MKTCTRCHEPKLLDCFSKSKRDGYRSVCKDCRRAEYKANAAEVSVDRKRYYAENQEAVKERVARYREQYPDRVKAANQSYVRRHGGSHWEGQSEYLRRWRADNPERIRQYEANRKVEKADELREYWASYRRTHPEQEKAKKHKRRARESAAGHFSAYDWKMICVTADYCCLRCGAQGVKLTPDHIIPLSLGGSNHRSNIQPLCMPCNQKKGVEITDYRFGDWDPKTMSYLTEQQFAERESQ